MAGADGGERLSGCESRVTGFRHKTLAFHRGMTHCAGVCTYTVPGACVPYLTAQAFPYRKWCEVKESLSQCGYSWLWPLWVGPGSTVHRQSPSSRTQTHSHRKGSNTRRRTQRRGAKVPRRGFCVAALALFNTQVCLVTSQI